MKPLILALVFTVTSSAAHAEPLRVAVSGNYLPLHGVKNGRVVGLEVDRTRRG